VLEDTVDLDLPVFADEMERVRRHDLNLVTDVDKLSRRGHSAIGIDAEIWCVLWHLDLSIDRERIQNQKKTYSKFLPASIAASESPEFVSERHNSDTYPGHLVVFTPLASGGNAGLSVSKGTLCPRSLAAPENRRSVAH
jgi:hypothetical protein